ncbi:MAG: hypothetical protein ABFS28_02140 [Bacteroidota bacterium]
MRNLVLFIFFSAISISLFAQSDSIVATKAFGGYRFEQNGEFLNGKALLQRMEVDQEAYAMMKRAKSNSDIASVLGFAGGFMIGWPLGTAIAGGDPNWVLAGIGAGCLAIGIPLSIQASKGMFQAVELYNSNLNGTYFEQGLLLRLGVATGGVGLTLDF